MSRWLRNVNALLENLDNQVEETVEDRFNQDDDAQDVTLHDTQVNGVDDILAKRGLLDKEEHVDLGNDDENEGESVVSDDGINFDGENSDTGTKDLDVETPYEDSNMKPSEVKDYIEKKESKSSERDTTKAFGEPLNQEEPAEPSDRNEDQIRSSDEQTKSAPAPTIVPISERAPHVSQSTTSLSIASATPTTKVSAAQTTTKDKEMRKYRRNILNLNSALEAAESEIEAQRNELERAASRMERDRSRFKQEKKAAEASHKIELAALIASHEKSMANFKEHQEEKVKEMERRILRAEQARVREGGERDAELAEALDRERMSIENVAKLTEENNTLVERVASLSTDISRLETRLEHASSQFDLASERERNAEEQLDKALSLHAKQLGVRQKRESVLEQTVADLGAALVVAKNKVEKGMVVKISGSGGDMEEEEDLKERYVDAQDEIETLRAQLTLERQRCQTLHTELQDLSKERADELSGAHARQRQYERNISDLKSTVAKLQTSLKRAHVGPDDDDTSLGESSEKNTYGESDFQYSRDKKKESDHLRKQITSLSEKILEQQSKIDRSSGEISTLKTRLQSAILRAETAETTVENANQRLLMMEMPEDGDYAVSGISSADEEMALTTSISRRQKGGSNRWRLPKDSDSPRRGFHRRSNVKSIRSALSLHPGRVPSGGCQETMAAILDTFDNIAIDMGSHFRHYPISRLAFMLYMVILHSWTFFLLVFHVHAQETGGLNHYSPESMIMSYHTEQVPRGIDHLSANVAQV